MSTLTLDQRLARYEAAKRRGVEFLLKHVNPDGSVAYLEDGFHFYRLPWTFTVCGETRAALRVCAWVRQHMLTEQGDFDGGHRGGGVAFAYANGTFCYGAHMARQYDLSHRGVGFLLSIQDRSGGFPDDILPDGSYSDHMDIPFTVGVGLALVATGKIEAARRVYGFLQHIWSQQDALPHRLYYTLSRRTQKVYREWPPEKQAKFVVIAQADAAQRWTVGGIAAAFLCRLYLADPNPAYVELAQQYMEFSLNSTLAQFKYAAACKSGWGASLLYQVTGERKYLDWALRVADWFADTQQPDGSWRCFWSDRPESSQITLAAEFVAHIDTILGAISSRT